MLHAFEIGVEADQVAELLQGFAPELSGLPLVQLESSGTDNWIFKLGEGHYARLPRRPAAADKILKEAQWLPHFQALPLATPQLYGQFPASEIFDHPWSIMNWIEGETPSPEALYSTASWGKEAGGFLKALQAMDPKDGPLAGEQNNWRGVPLHHHSVMVGRSIQGISANFDAKLLQSHWDRALAADVFGGPPLWMHCDLHANNVLIKDGQLAAVLDFGLLGRGDPACEMIFAWADLGQKARQAFFEALEADPAMIERGRGWALYSAVITLDYYQGRHPFLENRAKTSLAALQL